MTAMPVPEPTARDEELALEFLCVKDRTNLRGRPEGGQRCDSCHFYADPTREIAYCWHPELQVGVGFDHCCRRWQAIPGQA